MVVELLGEVRRGSYGVLFKAKWIGTPASVLARTISDEEAFETLQRRLRDSLQRLASVRHPNIANVYALYEPAPPTIGIVSERLAGAGALTVRDLTRENGISDATTKRILPNLASALHYLHSSSIVHGHMTSESVWIIGAPLFAKIADLHFASAGICTASDDDDECVAPEVNARPDDRRRPPCDIFSLGVISLHLLMGPGNVSELRRRLSDDHPLGDVLRRCLDSDANKRPTASDLRIRVERSSDVDEDDGGDGESWDEEKQRMHDRLERVETTFQLREISYRVRMDDMARQLRRWESNDVSDEIAAVSEIPEWKALPDLPHPCQTVATVFDDYLLVGDRGCNRLFVYDVNTRDYVRTIFHPDDKASFEGIGSSRRGELLAALVNEETWQLGIYAYDFENDTWSEVCRRPADIQLGIVSVVFLKDRIVQLGGVNRMREKTNFVLMYRLDDDEWQLLPHIPIRRKGYNAAVLKDRLYVSGAAIDDDDEPSRIDVLNLETFEWESGLASPRCPGASLCCFRGHLMSVGGGTTASSAVDVRDDDRDVWIPLPSLRRARYFHDVVATTTEVFVAGGQDKNEKKSASVEVLDLHASH